MSPTAVQGSSTFPSALSVDVEEHFQVEAFADRITPEMWHQFPSRVAENTQRILRLLARHQVRATFFVVGWVAERNPGMVREIAAAGHEIGCHSYLHRALWRMTPEEFRQDTRRAVAAIEDAAGRKVRAYRAPTFSVVEGTLWALEILAEEGFFYDSSVFPVRHDLYGIPNAPRFPFRWKLGNGLELLEMPMTTVEVLGRNLPAAGGGYLRILPLWYNRWAVDRARNEGRAAMVYFHPWEVDPEQPRIPGSWKSRARHYTNLAQMETRLCALLAGSPFAPIEEVLRRELDRGPLPVRDIAGRPAEPVPAPAAAR